MEPTRDQLAAIVKDGTFDALIGASETAWFECKGQPYQLSGDAAKRELAKDVSSFANASGGMILIGLKTKASPAHFGDEVEEVRPFAQGLVNVTQYKDVLDSWIYPKIDNLAVKWVPTAEDNSKGVVVIAVPAQTSESKPYLIVRTFDGAKQVETVFGYAERKGDTSPPLSVSELQAALRSGFNFDAKLNLRLDGIETLLRSGLQASAETTIKQASAAELKKRIDQATSYDGLGEKRCFILSATPEPPGNLRSIFLSSEDSIKRQLEHPPALRWAGWDLTHHDRAKIVRGEHVRVTNGDTKVIDLYRDGAMVFVARADNAFLAWGRDDRQRINPLALSEATYSFFSFYDLVLKDFVVAPQDLHVSVQLRNMHLSGEKSSLAPYGLNSTAQMFDHKSKDAPTNDACVEFRVSAADFDPHRIAYQVVREVYLWFGLEEDTIPYFKNEAGKMMFDTEAVKKI